MRVPNKLNFKMRRSQGIEFKSLLYQIKKKLNSSVRSKTYYKLGDMLNMIKQYNPSILNSLNF